MKKVINITISVPVEFRKEVELYIARKYPMASFSRAIKDMLEQAMIQDKKENE